MNLPAVPQLPEWKDGVPLFARDFTAIDERALGFAHLAAALSDPWPWGFVTLSIDETALASDQLRVACSGLFPDGHAFTTRSLVQRLPSASDADALAFVLDGEGAGGAVRIRIADEAPAERVLPLARLVSQSAVWVLNDRWSAPALLVAADHPLRADAASALGALAALGAGFMTTLRMPGAADRAAARRLSQVAAVIAQGVGVLEAYLAAPFVTPGRLGIEARRLALGVRGAAGVFEPLADVWDPADQRGSLRAILARAEATAASLGLPFRVSVFRPRDEDDARMLVVEGIPRGAVLLGVEASRPSDLLAARAWLEGAALAAPERIEEALSRRVGGCAREPVRRDPQIGVSSGPLLALYRVADDMSWRGSIGVLALASKTAPPPDVSFLVFTAEDALDPDASTEREDSGPSQWYPDLAAGRASWAGGPAR